VKEARIRYMRKKKKTKIEYVVAEHQNNTIPLGYYYCQNQCFRLLTMAFGGMKNAM
jgi:hypothetical protein